MEANSAGEDPPPGQPLEQKELPKDKKDLILAGMMVSIKLWSYSRSLWADSSKQEELGHARIDALPLGDNGINVPVSRPVKKQVADDPNDPTARWRSKSTTSNSWLVFNNL
jgi:hypothetical protein